MDPDVEGSLRRVFVAAKDPRCVLVELTVGRVKQADVFYRLVLEPHGDVGIGTRVANGVDAPVAGHFGAAFEEEQKLFEVVPVDGLRSADSGFDDDKRSCRKAFRQLTFNAEVFDESISVPGGSTPLEVPAVYEDRNPLRVTVSIWVKYVDGTLLGMLNALVPHGLLLSLSPRNVKQAVMMSKTDIVDLESMVAEIDGTRAKREKALRETTNKDLVLALERAVSLIDVYKAARDADDESADLYLANARSMILGIMGVQ